MRPGLPGRLCMESILVALIGGSVTLVGVVASNSRSRAVLSPVMAEIGKAGTNAPSIEEAPSATPKAPWLPYRRQGFRSDFPAKLNSHQTPNTA